MKEGKFKMMKLMNKKNKVLGNKGFSLIELIIVIAIMAVLMVILAPQLLKYVENSRITSDDQIMAEVRHAVEIALSDETVYDAVTTGDTITWTSDTGAIASVACTELATEVLTIVEAKEGQSKKYDGQVYTITVNIDDTDGTFSLTDAIA
jgi:type IV pilus assembly protein PilA